MSLDDDLHRLFATAPLPYRYVCTEIDSLERTEDPHLFFFVNQVATELTRLTFQRFGFHETNIFTKCNALWGRQLTDKEFSQLRPHQKVNHFCGSFLIGRKDNLHQRMKELTSRIGPLDFYPKSFLLPNERDQAQTVFHDHPVWIFKPAASSGGKGIKFILSEQTELPSSDGIIQVYITNPYLINGKKFDIRLYVLVTSIDPLRLYIYENGLARFAVHDYQRTQFDDVQAHLTNARINKTSESYSKGTLHSESIENSKWSLRFLFEFLKTNGVDTENLMSKIEKAVTSVMIAGLSVVKGHHQRFVKSRHISYELFGVDVLIDDKLNVSVLEVNISPDMSAKDSDLDRDLKSPMMNEILKIARIIDCDPRSSDPCPGITRIERACDHSFAIGRVSSIESGAVDPWNSPNFADLTNVRDYLEESSILSGFRLLFPRPADAHTFIPCFPKLTYHDTVFISWIKRSPNDRAAVIAPHIPKYAKLST